MAHSNDQFSKKLYNQMMKEETNLIMSPFSASAVMPMVSAGARGTTLQQITKGFSFPSQPSLQLGYQGTLPALMSTDSITLEVANTVFLMQGFSVLPDFQAVLRRSFHSSIHLINFGNRDAAARTAGLRGRPGTRSGTWSSQRCSTLTHKWFWSMQYISRVTGQKSLIQS